MGQQGFWDIEQRHKKLEQKQDLLVRVGHVLDLWIEFRCLSQIHTVELRSAEGV